MLPLIDIKKLRIAFRTDAGPVTAVDDITFKVMRNEILGIAGESGSGKSVTSLSILRLLPKKSAFFQSGSILFSPDGKSQNDIIQLDESALLSVRGSRIAMIFQDPMTSLNPVFTCGEQVMEALLLHRHTSHAMAKAKTLELFERVRLPDPLQIFSRYPHQLSGGQKQRVMIAMAMSGNPSLLICDEPTTALDVTVQRTVLELLKELQRDTGMGVIFISHDLGVISGIADRVIIMHRGRIVEQGLSRDVLQRPTHPYTKGLLACRPALHQKGERLPVVNDFLAPPPLYASNGQHDAGLSEPSFDPPQTISKHNEAENNPGFFDQLQPLLAVKELSVHFPAKRNFLGRAISYAKAVDNVSFNILEGETLGLVGESGCGKTTLGRTLLGLIRSSSGSIHYKGVDLTQPGNTMQRFRKEMQIIFQDPYASLNPSLTIGSALEEPLKVHEPSLTAAERKSKVLDILERVNLSASQYHRYSHEFSGGQRQRIVIARALILKPSFVICDESVSALDVSVQAQVLNLLNDLKREFRFTCLFISHDLSVIRYLSDRIMVMNKGRIEEIGPSETIYNHPRSAYTAKLIAAIPTIGE